MDAVFTQELEHKVFKTFPEKLKCLQNVFPMVVRLNCFRKRKMEFFKIERFTMRSNFKLNDRVHSQETYILDFRFALFVSDVN